MEFLSYTLVFCAFLVTTYSQSAWPTNDGCIIEQDHGGLIVAKCLNKVISEHVVSYSSYNYGQYCLNSYSYTNHQLKVKYKFSQYYSDTIPEFRDPYTGYSACKDLVYSLDLSENTLSDFPHLAAMNNLCNLTITNTNLTFAKISNRNQLNGLTDLNLSNNKVVSVGIVDNEYAFGNLKKLNLSYNYIANLTDGVFNTLNRLESLDLSYNEIKILNVLTFEGIKFIKSLNISRNRITDINSSLVRFNLLKNLDLSHNSLEHLDKNDFEKLIELQKLDVSFNRIKTIEEKSFQQCSDLQAIYLNDNVLESLHKNIFTNLEGLKNLDISQNKLKSLEKGLFKGLNISLFSVAGNDLEGTLEDGMFEGLGSVEVMDLSYQKIEYVTDFSFRGLLDLKQLLLNNNNIRNLSQDSLSNLNNLQELDLTSNNISGIDFAKINFSNLKSLSLRQNILSKIESENFKNLSSLQYLDVAYNNIRYVAPNSFCFLKELINFDISNNPLTGTLLEKTFQGLSSLPNLDLFNTSLSIIKNNSFSDMKNLNKLNMSYGVINELNFNVFSNTGNIKVIDLSHNRLVTFDINATAIENLEILHLNHNHLNTISPGLFYEMSKLTKLILSYNNVDIISDLTFCNPMSLNYLDLSYNKNLNFKDFTFKMTQNITNLMLSGIPTNITFASTGKNVISDLTLSGSLISNIMELKLSHLQELVFLNLRNNTAEIINSSCFNNVTNLQNLDLSYNKIKYAQPGTFKDNVQLSTLNISHNLLTEISYGLLRGLINLEILDISYNNIKSLQSERFYEVKSLNFLIADHNQISYVSSEEFRGTSLSTLSIGENPLPCDILINFKKHGTTFTVTAIKRDETYGENVDGITCNMDKTDIKGKASTDKFTRDSPPIIFLSNFSNKVHLDDLFIRDYSQYFINLTKQLEIFKNSAKEYNTKLLQDKIVDFMSLNNLSDKIENNTNVSEKNMNRTNMLLTKIIDFVTVNNLTRHPDVNFSVLETESNKTNRLLIKILEQISSHNITEFPFGNYKATNDSYGTNLLLMKTLNNMALSNLNEKTSIFPTLLLYAIFAIVLVLVILHVFVLLKNFKLNMLAVQRNSLINRHIENSGEDYGL